MFIFSQFGWIFLLTATERKTLCLPTLKSCLRVLIKHYSSQKKVSRIQKMLRGTIASIEMILKCPLWAFEHYRRRPTHWEALLKLPQQR